MSFKCVLEIKYYIFSELLDHCQSSRLNNDVTYGKLHEYMTLSHEYMTSIFAICDTALTRGHCFDKHDKSRHYLTLMTDCATVHIIKLADIMHTTAVQ